MTATAVDTSNMNDIQLEVGIEVSPALIKEQLILEMGMRNAGQLRFRKAIQKAHKRGQEDETPYADKIIGVYISKVATRLQAWVEEGRSRAGARRHAQPYIESIDYNVTAMLGLKIICERLMSDKAPLGGSAISIARMMENEIKCASLRAQDRQAFNGILKAANEKGEYKRKVDVLRFLTKQDGGEWSRWPEKTCMHIGMVVINCIQDCVSLVEFYDQYDSKGRTTTCMRPTSDTKEAVNELIAKAMQFCGPVLEPTVIPPKPWVSGELKGGYWTDYIPRREIVKVRNKAYLEQLKYADMPKMLNALNAIQNTKWRVNKNTMKLLKELLQRNSELGGAPRAELLELPEAPFDVAYNEEARKEYRQAARAVHEENVRITSKRLTFLQTVNTAERYADYEAIYMPHNVDFRGRVYPLPSLNPQGADYCKALLEFSEGVALGEHGLEWLQIHLANLFGVDKVAYLERIQWCLDNEEMLIAIATDPFSNREWCDADKPFQAYSAVCDYIAALSSPVPEEYESRTPIALDGSNSGVQHLSLAFLDPIGGKHVCLVPDDKPADIYKVVADKTVAKMQIVLDDQKQHCAETEQDTEVPTDAQMAAWWLEFGITRKECKRNTMTFAYGSKQRGMGSQIMEDLLRPFMRKNPEDHSLLKVNERGRVTTTLTAMYLANYLAKLNYESITETVVKAAEAMDWMQACARVVASEGRPVTWETPLNFPVVQNYRKTKANRVETYLAGTRKVLSIREETIKIDKLKSANAISPNIVHSLDAGHLLLTVDNAHTKGITDFALIHDSFGTHAGNTELFYDVIRESFIELYEGDYLEELRQQFIAQVPPEKAELIPPLPAKGDLDPKVILDSLYCFA